MSVRDLTPDEPAAEQVVPTVELKGRRFPVSDRGVPLLSMMKLASIAKRQAQSGTADPADELESMSIMYELVRSVIADDAWPQFEEHANACGASVDDFQGLMGQATAARSRFPTQPSSGSPGGQSTTAPSSAAGSSSPAWSTPQGSIDVQRRLEAQGRPDMALVVMRAREASTRSSTG